MSLKLPSFLKKISSTQLTFLLALYFMCCANFVIIEKIYSIVTTTIGLSVPFLISIPIFFLCAFVFVITPFVSKYIAKPVLIFVVIASTLVNYGASNFGVIFNQDMMANILVTTPTEAGSYLHTRFFVWFFFLGILPALYLAFVKIEYKPFRLEILRKALLMVGAVCIVLLMAAFFYKTYATVARNNPKLQKDIVPTYFISSTIKYIKNTHFRVQLPYRPIGDDAKRKKVDSNYLTIVIIGETARSANYQLNGYDRPTNAHSVNIPNLVAFQNATSCGTATEISVPCMISFLGRSNYSLDVAESQDNVIDVAKKAGLQNIWIDNNTGCKGTCKNIDNFTLAKGYQQILGKDAMCKDEDCHDDLILEYIDPIIKNFKGKDGVIYFHLMGSHGPTYFKRYPKNHEKFKPACETSDLQTCTREQIINSYDNTILFTDYIMAELISHLKKYPNYKTSLIYMSDHGESLGENGIYLHGMPYAIAPKEQTHIPFIMWLSDTMIAHKKLDMACLKEYAQKGTFSHDNLSSTLLGLLDIETKNYVPEKDVLYSCQKSSKKD